MSSIDVKYNFMKTLNNILDQIKVEFGLLISFRWVDIALMLMNMLALVFLVTISIVLKVLFLPLDIAKRLLRNNVRFQGFGLWFGTYLSYKWGKMPNYDICRVRTARKNGFRGLSQKPLNRWAYWVYKDYRERK